ncbi:MAG: aldo/keto reductase [Treponema sp.]|jgi:predicted aldo/keto reductase-like oxidoreductase|nr:aldo/keto reductase [Treponema sp.]
MLYREYGKTGKKVSLLGFGGMRFANIDDHEECIRTMLAAAEGGVNYFDTAPGYFDIKSETVFGKAFAEFNRRKLPYYCATKTTAATESAIRKEIEAQLKRMDIPAVDFYHIWCVTTLEDWRERKKNNILQTFRKLKEEGLIRHICISSHLIKDEIKELLMEDVFEGVLFGYSAYNIQTRQAAFDAIREKKIGAVIMNPLGGGIIPQHPELFDFIKREGENTIVAALRFLWDHPDITVSLVGFENVKQVQEALSAMETYQPRTAAELDAVKAGAPASLEGVCTGCAYCVTEGLNCSHGVPIPKFMDAYNHKLFLSIPGQKDPIADRLNWHWSLKRSDAGKCTACGECEKACTQHINIIERLKEIAG